MINLSEVNEKSKSKSLADGEPLRVLKMSHTASLSTYRARERALVKRHPVDLSIVTVKDWPHLGSEPDSGADPYILKAADSVLSGNVPLFAFDPTVFAKAIREHKPHLIDIHQEPYSVAGFEATWLASKLVPQTPLVFCTAQNIQKRYPPPFRWTEQFVYERSCGAYMCCLEAEQVLRNKGFRGFTEILPLGVDEELYRPNLNDAQTKLKLKNELGISDGFVIGYFGRLESYKGPQLLIEALSRLTSQGFNAHLLIAGSGVYLNELIELGEQKAISQRIHFAGSLKASETPQYISLCDVVAVPSLTRKNWKEQFGRVPVEAMACGVSVISSDSGSLPEVVSGVGLVVAENDAGALAHAVQQLIEDEDLRTQTVTAGLERVRDRFTWDVIADRTYDLYKKALNLNSYATK